MVRAQFQAKQEGALEWRIRRANLPERWTMETSAFARQPGVNRKQIRGFAELEFITKAENIVLVGKTGFRKPGLSCGLLQDPTPASHARAHQEGQPLLQVLPDGARQTGSRAGPQTQGACHYSRTCGGALPLISNLPISART